jgi:hypothetical protein
MLHVWKWIVEMMEECPPALIFSRLPKTNGVVFERRPLNQESVAIRLLEAPLQFERLEPGIAPIMRLASVKACSKAASLLGMTLRMASSRTIW